MRDLAGEELEEALGLVGVTTQRRHELRRVGLLGRLQRAHVDLEPVAEALDTTEHAHGITLAEDAVEAPRRATPGLGDLSRRRGSSARYGAPALVRSRLARDGVDAVDRPVLGELGDGGHGRSL